MKTQHISSASAAAVLMVSMAAFAQTPQSSSPSTQTTTPSTEATSPSSSQADQKSAQSSRQPETPVTIVGCVMRETDYRKANDSGKGGPVGTGLGRGDEFVLVNAMKTTAGSPSTASSIDCASATGAAGSGSGEAFELGGSREKDLASYVGQKVEITGTLKEAATTTKPSGEAKPTGGFDPLKQDLKLFEVDIVSFRPMPASQSTAAAPAAAAPAPEPAAATPAPAPAPEPAPRAAAQSPATAAQPAAPATPPSQQSASASSRQGLPRTASPLPVTALFGLLSMATGLVLRRRG
jgi:hypothetical protein